MRNERRGILITTVLLGVLIIGAGVGGGLMLALSPLRPAERQPARVEYRIIGDADRAVVAFLNDEEALERHEMTPPGSYRFRASSGRALSLLVERTSASGAVGCAILVDGRILQSQNADAQRQKAHCDGTVP